MLVRFLQPPRSQEEKEQGQEPCALQVTWCMVALLYSPAQRPRLLPRAPAGTEMLVLQGPSWDPSAGPLSGPLGHLVHRVVGLDNTPALLCHAISSHPYSLQECISPFDGKLRLGEAESLSVFPEENLVVRFSNS